MNKDDKPWILACHIYVSTNSKWWCKKNIACFVVMKCDESFFDFLFPTQCHDIEQHANKWGGNVNCQLIFSWFISWWNRMNNNATWWNMMKPVCFTSGVTILVADHNLRTQALQHLDMCYNQIYDRGRKRRYGRNSTVWANYGILVDSDGAGNHLENGWTWFPLCRQNKATMVFSGQHLDPSGDWAISFPRKPWHPT